MSSTSGNSDAAADFELISFSGQRYSVIDDVFSEDRLAAIRQAEKSLSFSVTQGPVDPLFDGVSQRSSGHHLSSALDDTSRGQFANAVRRATNSLSMESVRIYDDVNFWRYPQGSGLGWHDDGFDVDGAVFIMYISPEWRATWGGELELIDCSVDDVPCQYWDLSRDLMGAPGPRICVAPRPNRLVVMKTKTFHRLRAVDTRAGDTLRRSMTGHVSAK